MLGFRLIDYSVHAKEELKFHPFLFRNFLMKLLNKFLRENWENFSPIHRSELL